MHSPPRERRVSHGRWVPTRIGSPAPFEVIRPGEQSITFLSSSRVSNSLPLPVSLVGNHTSTFCPSKNTERLVDFFKRSASYSGAFKVSSCNSRKKTNQYSSAVLGYNHIISAAVGVWWGRTAMRRLPVLHLHNRLQLLLQGCSHLNLGTIILPLSHTLELPPPLSLLPAT